MRHTFLSFLAIILSALLCSHTALSQDLFLPDVESEVPMSEDEVTEMFSGQTHRGTYNFEMQNFEGYSFEETTSVDGRTTHQLGSRTDTGIWEQTDGQICYTYDAPDLIPACFVFYLRGNCVYHYQQTVQGLIAPRFTAVSVIKGESPSCEPPIA